jgi:HK97 family phage prohead protease
MQTREQRFHHAEVRTETVAGRTFISGYTARFGIRSDDLGGFVEQIDRHAFDRTLAAGGDVTCTFNHDPSRLLGRRSRKTLELSTDGAGLFYRCDVATETHAGQDVLAYIRRGDIFQNSFGFLCRRDKWVEESDNSGQRIQVRTLLDVDLFDCGPVTSPAYPDTSVGIDEAARMQALFPEGMSSEMRSRIGRSAPEPLIAGLTPSEVNFYLGQKALFRTLITAIANKVYSLPAEARDAQPLPISDEETYLRDLARRQAERLMPNTTASENAPRGEDV